MDGAKAGREDRVLGRKLPVPPSWPSSIATTQTHTVPVVAWACTFTRAGVPGVLFERVLVASDERGQGIGARLHARMLRDLPGGVARLRGLVFDTGQRALDVVGHWACEPYELCHVSRLELDALATPTVVADLTIEAAPDLGFADEYRLGDAGPR